MRSSVRPLSRPLRSSRTRTPAKSTRETRPPRLPTFTSSWKPSGYGGVEENGIQNDHTGQVIDLAALRAERVAQDGEKNVVSDLTLARRYAIWRLQRCTELVACSSPTPRIRAAAWRAYSFAKWHARDALPMLPKRIWDVLWDSQSIRLRSNRQARAHVIELYRDMVSTGHTGTAQASKKAAYLESLFLNRGEDEALREWEEWHAQANLFGQEVNRPKLKVGIWLHALAGAPGRAREIANVLFKTYPSWYPDIVGVLFRAQTRSRDREHHKAAWDLYSKMKDQFGEEMRKSDYDNFFIGFLEARHLQHATQVLGDMVTERHLAKDYADKDIEEVLRKLHLLSGLATDISQATAIGLFAVTTFPPPYHLRIFGEWLKQAVVQKAPYVALQILDAMQTRGCEPETVHFNLLLKALFRAKNRDHVLKAENIGWHMIDRAFKDFRKATGSPSTAEKIREYREKEGEHKAQPHVGPSVVSKLPPANAVTIALLMEHHAHQSQWEHVNYLKRQMENSGILPNSDIMNVLMKSQCRQGKYNEVWGTYRSCTASTGNVFPTGATFRCLWKTLRLALGDHETRDNSTLPSPRQLLKETVGWWEMVRSRFDAERYRVGLAAADHGALIGLVMHSFSYKADLVGSLVALHALRHRFGIFPSPKAADILQRQIAWIDMRSDSKTERSQYSISGANRKNVERMAHIYQLLMDARLKRMKITAEQYTYLSRKQLGDLNLNTISEFVRVILKRQYSPDVVEAMIDEAKEEIGIPDLPTGDLDAYEVA